MRYEYFKIIDTVHVQSLLDGNLYMNSLSYFRELEYSTKKEENKAQKDPMESVCGAIHKNRLRQFGLRESVLKPAECRIWAAFFVRQGDWAQES